MSAAMTSNRENGGNGGSRNVLSDRREERRCFVWMIEPIAIEKVYHAENCGSSSCFFGCPVEFGRASIEGHHRI
jgi:hypothetical protein